MIWRMPSLHRKIRPSRPLWRQIQKHGTNDENGQLIYDHTGIGTEKDNINTSIGMKKMPVLVLARLAEIKITGTGITFMTVLVVNNIKMPVLESDVLCTRTGIFGKRMPLPV